MKRTTPTAVFGESKYCPGCGHGIFDRIFTECLDEFGIVDKAIGMIDIACSNNVTRYVHSDYIVGPHGRILETATGAKRVRPECFVYARGGDGCAYAIGLAETYHAAMRNENITVFIINNNNYGMTGGQMAPTTLVGQVTTSSPMGKDPNQFGYPIDVTQMLSGLGIAYLARGSLASPADIRTTKKYVRKAIQYQLEGKGFSMVEILSPCPTNWNLTPLKSWERMKNEVAAVYPTGEFIDNGKEG